jgi:hypothetical protein
MSGVFETRCGFAKVWQPISVLIPAASACRDHSPDMGWSRELPVYSSADLFIGGVRSEGSAARLEATTMASGPAALSRLDQYRCSLLVKWRFSTC